MDACGLNQEYLNKETENKTGRAWLEISVENLKWNYHQLLNCLPKGTKCMAVVKADAYGHGAVSTAKALMEEGCDFFAVATLEEGIELRNAGIEGKILILGYTMPASAFLLHNYHLTQTIVDVTHAKALAATGFLLTGHLAVDTGMNRLGISVEDKAAILEVLNMNNLTIEGICSHMSVPDSPLMEDKRFTLNQIHKFMELKKYLTDMGKTGYLYHMQSSYGILNYPMKEMDYVRPGIALYGCTSNHKEEKLGIALKPALQLKGRIACVRTVSPGEYVSYGRTYEAKKVLKAAVVTIGYADGIPRNLSQKGFALLAGEKVPVIGRICMDQTILDVTKVNKVSEGDVVTFIGQDENEEIKAVEMAETAGTITNELISRLGSRLTKIYV